MAIEVPEELRAFLYTLLTSSKDSSKGECCQRVQRLMKSFAQDLVFGVTRGRIKPPKQILLSYAVKTLTNNVELVSILNRYGHRISFCRKRIVLSEQTYAGSPSVITGEKNNLSQ